MVSSFISPLTGVNTSNMLVKLNFITGAVQEFVWSVSYPVLILNSWLFQPFQAKILWNGSKQAEKQAEQTGKPFWLAAGGSGWQWLLPGRVNFALQAPDCNRNSVSTELSSTVFQAASLAQLNQIAKTRQKLNFENSWNWVVILLSATIWQVLNVKPSHSETEVM